MKSIPLASRFGQLCACATAATLWAILPVPTRAADKDAEALRDRIAKLEHQAASLKADGHSEEARNVMREVLELRRESELAEPAPRAEDRDRRIEELNRQLDELKGQLKEGRSNGETDETAAIKDRIQDTERELDRIKSGPGRDFGGLPGLRPQRERTQPIPRHRMDRRPPVEAPPPSQVPEAQNRLRHLQAAIENLHAAGLHEMAERLAQEAERMRQQVQAPPRRLAGPRPPEREMASLRQEVQELRRAVEEMRHQIDELSRPRP